MPTVSRERFRAALRALAPGEFAAFVAALYRGRGRDAAVVDERRLRVDGRDVHVHAPGRRGRASVPEGVDAVVTAGVGRPRGVPGDVEVVDGDALYERAVHGVGADERERLFERLDCDPAAPTSADARSSGLRFRWGHVAAAVFALALVVAGVLGAAPPPGSATAGGPDAAGDGAAGGLSGERTPFVPGANVTTTTPTTTPTPTPTPLAPADYPAWLSANGSVDAAALADAHERIVSGRQYTLLLTASEAREGAITAAVSQRVSVRSPTVYRAAVSVRGRPADPATPRLGPVYADGERAYVAVNRSNRTYRVRPLGTVAGERAGPPGPYRVDASARGRVSPVAGVAAAYVARVLAAGNPNFHSSSVEGDTRLFYLRIRGDEGTSPAVTDVTTIAIVESRGFVRRLHRQYDVPVAGITVSVTMRYRLGTATVTPPGWYRNGTRLDGSGAGTATRTGD